MEQVLFYSSATKTFLYLGTIASQPCFVQLNLRILLQHVLKTPKNQL